MRILPTRADFLWAAKKGQKAGGPHLLIQGVKRRPSKWYSDDDPINRIGYTASKKVGNAPRRARAKRRMRTLVRRHLGPVALPGYDYVFIARDSLCFAPFETLEAQTKHQLAKLNKRLLESTDVQPKRRNATQPHDERQQTLEAPSNGQKP